MKIYFSIFGLLVSIASCGQVKIKGIVYDKKELVPGVVVVELGSDNKVTTNANGEFEITTSTNTPTLTFNFIGFHTRTVLIKKKRDIKVKLKRVKFAKDIARRVNSDNGKLVVADSSFMVDKV